MLGVESMNLRNRSEWRAWLPHALVVCWLVYLAITIGQHAFNSVQVPWGDPLSYMQKAASFWQAVDQGRLFNPFNLSPTVRPPGTVLMSYPLGFSPDFHWFYFRSIFVPILSVVAAVYVAAGKTQARATGWWVAAIAFLFSSLPMFYWFDWNDEHWVNNGWGMVDNFQAGIAALAAAALVRSLVTRSQPWLLVCSLLASLTLLIKPSGLMVMALIGVVWLIVVAFEWRSTSRSESPSSSLRAYALKGAAVFFVVYASVIALCVFSDYLSRRNFAYAMRALDFYQDVAVAASLWLFHLTSGEAVVLWLAGVGVLLLKSLSAKRDGNSLLSARVSGLVVGSLVIWILGVWYWLVLQAGTTQIRYFYPFMLMGIICMIPAALYVRPKTNRLTRSLMMSICFLPALNIGALLAAGDSPSDDWETLSGVSVAVPAEREEVRQAYAFLNEVRKTKKQVRVYYFNGVHPSMFAFVGAYEKIVRPELAGFDPVDPMDWSRGFVVRVSELLDSDYILTRKYSSQDIARLTPRQLDSFVVESKAFDVWLSTLDERAGVEVASEGHVLRLMRIVDRPALDRAIKKFISEHSWRPEFLAANQPLKLWWSAENVAADAKNVAATEIGFAGVYELHALSISKVDNAIKIEAWWEELRHEEANNKRYLFLHLVDSAGDILYIHQIALHPYDPPFADRRWHYGTATFVNVLPDEKLASLAFGVYQPPGSFLLADKGKTDWNGRRVLVPIAPSGAQVGPVSARP